MAGRPFLREVYDNEPNCRVNLQIEYPEDL